MVSVTLTAIKHLCVKANTCAASAYGRSVHNVLMMTLQKIVKISVTRTYMYMCFNFLPEEARDLDSVYFLRTTEGMVPLPNTISEADSMLPGLFEIGLLNGHSLMMLQQVINKVSE